MTTLPRAICAAAMMTSVLCGPALGQSPSTSLSHNMAECGGVLRAAALWGSGGTAPETLDLLARHLRDIGAEEARAEGVFYPDFYVESVSQRAYEELQRAGRGVLDSADFAARFAACETLAVTSGTRVAAG